jgi:hypothetical protein
MPAHKFLGYVTYLSSIMTISIGLMESGVSSWETNPISLLSLLLAGVPSILFGDRDLICFCCLLALQPTTAVDKDERSGIWVTWATLIMSVWGTAVFTVTSSMMGPLASTNPEGAYWLKQLFWFTGVLSERCISLSRSSFAQLSPPWTAAKAFLYCLLVVDVISSLCRI